jgi:hypothetical protein
MSARRFVGGLGAVAPETAAFFDTDRALYAKLATVSFLRALRQVVDSTVGDVVQLVRTLPFRFTLSRAIPSFFLLFWPSAGLRAGHIRSTTRRF